MPSPSGYWLKRHFGGIPTMIMSAIVLAAGLFGCYYAYDMFSSVVGAKESAGGLILFIGFLAILGPTLVVVGTLGIIGGFRKLFPKKK